MFPSNWTTASLGDVAKLASGGTPSRENPDYWNGDIPWFSAKDLKSFQLLDSQEHISHDGSRNGTRVVEAGTILILVRGMTLLKSFPVCMTTRRSAFNQDLRAVVPIKPIDSEFLAYWLLANEPRVMSLVDQAGHGTGRLAPDRLAELDIAFPSNISEQKAIARVLSTWDRGIRQLSDLIAAKLRFKQGLMQQLLTGKRRFPKFRDEWIERVIEDVALVNPSFPRTVESEESVAFLAMADIGEGCIHRQQVRTVREVANGMTKFADGDILVPKITPCFENGKGCHCKNLIGGVGFGSTEFVVIRANATVDSRLLFAYTMSFPFRSKGGASMSGTGGQQRLQTDFIRSYRVRFSKCRREQNAIAEVFDTADREIDLLRRELDALKTQKKGLMQKLLTGQVRVPASGGRKSPVSQRRGGKS